MRLVRLLPVLTLFALLLGACANTAHLQNLFNPEGIGLNEEAEVQRGPHTGETVTVTGYDGHATVETTLGSMPLSHLAVQSNTYYWCFGAWEFIQDPDLGDHWAAPHSELSIGNIDLRTLEQAGQPGGIPEGSGLFVYHTDPSDADLTCKADAGEQGNTLTTNQEKNLIKSRLGLSGGTKIDAVTICGVLLELMTVHAEEIGMKPLQKETDGIYRIYMGTPICEGLPPFD